MTSRDCDIKRKMIDSVSRRAFVTSSGSYNVRASELAKERPRKALAAVVQFLDDTQHTFHVDVSFFTDFGAISLCFRKVQKVRCYSMRFFNIWNYWNAIILDFSILTRKTLLRIIQTLW